MRKMFILSVLLLLLSTQVFGASYSYYLLNLDSVTYKPDTVYAGNELAVAATVENNTVNRAENIMLTLLTGSNFEDIDVEKEIEVIPGGSSETVVFRIRAKEGVPAGAYTLPLQMKYNNYDDEITDNENVTITVSEIYRIAIDELKVSNYYPHIGEDVTVKAYIKNTGSIEARNVLVNFSLVGEDDFGEFIVLSETNEDLGLIDEGATKSVEFKLKPSEMITPSIYSFSLNADCLDCDDEADETFSIQVYGFPDMFISGVDYSIKGIDSKNMFQGNSFSLSVQLDNLGEEDAKKVEIEIETQEGILGSKKSYVGSIEADDSSAGLFDLIVARTAKTGYQDIIITVNYLDELDQPQSMTENFSLYIGETPPESPIGLLISVLLILVVLYFIIKMVFRQLAIRKLR